jgi:TRAP-type mannitol/chloroaromatic compound transport system permease small subunit
MQVQRFLLFADGVSTWAGKAFAWIIILLTGVICVEVFKRYILNDPTAWIFSAQYMMYGTLFMMTGAYTLAQNGHVRGDFLYGSMRPRTQAWLDLVLYIVFFLPGITALVYAGWTFADASWVIHEHVSDTANGPPVYPFKAVIPIAGALVLLQGIAEIVRCVVCIRTGQWPARLKDAAEIDVVEEQLAGSQYVDKESRDLAIARVHEIDEEARQRGMGGDAKL